MSVDSGILPAGKNGSGTSKVESGVVLEPVGYLVGNEECIRGVFGWTVTCLSGGGSTMPCSR